MEDKEKEFRKSLEGMLEKATSHLEIALYDLKRCKRHLIDRNDHMKNYGTRINIRQLIEIVNSEKSAAFQVNKYLGITNSIFNNVLMVCEVAAQSKK